MRNFIGMLRRSSIRFAALAALIPLSSCAHAPRAVVSDRLEPVTRFSASIIGADTLSSAALITRLAPDPAGDAVAFVVADRIRGLRAALALSREGDRNPGLLWPDSVRDAWWGAPHFLAFTTETGAGVLAVVDVHAATLAAVSDPDSATSHPGAMHPRMTGPAISPALVLRASAVLRTIAGGKRINDVPSAAQRSPDGRWLAVHGARRTGQGQLSEPVWVFVDAQSGEGRLADRARTMDSLPALAAGWTKDGRFIYARGREVREIRPAP